MLEKIAAEVDGRGRAGDERLLQAITALIADKRDQLDGDS
jgi:hypothetical protein